MAPFEAKYHTLTLERMKPRFKISKTLKNLPKWQMENSGKKKQPKTCFWHFQICLKRFSLKVDPKCYTILESSVHKVDIAYLEIYLRVYYGPRIWGQ